MEDKNQDESNESPSVSEPQKPVDDVFDKSNESPSVSEPQKPVEDVFDQPADSKGDEVEQDHSNNDPSPSNPESTTPISEELKSENTSSKYKPSPVPNIEVKLQNVTVRIPDASKDNDVVMFRVYVQKNGEDKLSFVRRYEDFQYLHHCLKCEATDLGIIFPPLPLGPLVDLKEIIKHNKEQYGSECTTIPPEQFRNDCQRLEKYINLVLQHPLLINQHCLEDFLLKTEPPVRVNVSVGLVSKVSSSIADYIRSPPKDIDEHFQNERDRIVQQSAAIKTTATNFYKFACSLFRLSTSEEFLANSFIQGNVYGVENPISHCEMKLMSRISDVYKDENHCDQVAGNNCLKTLSKTLDFLTSYYDSVKETLNRRNVLMVEYENATKALSNAKPQRVEQLTQTKRDKEDAYEDCTKLLKIELEAFSQRRVSELAQSLVKYGNSQITAAVDRQSILVTHLNTIKALSFD